jgi:16S rRNA G966 N2-methylase RsmD
MKLKIADIKIPRRKRAADPHKVKELADSIGRLGLMNPVTLTQDKVLVAGMHRIAAHKLLGLDFIEATIKTYTDIQKQLGELDENLVRNELSILEEAEQLLSRDELLTAMNVRTKLGSNRYAKVAHLKTDNVIASEIGISTRTLQERKQIARNILPSVKDALRGTRYADNGHGLLQLARQPDHIQRLAVKKIFSKEPQRSIKIDVNEHGIVKMAIQQAYREHSLKKYNKLSKQHRVPESIQVMHGDFRKVCVDIPSDSISLVCTDPPYSKEALPLYKDLADVSYRLLKPSGFLVSFVGSIYLPDVIDYFRSSGLKYHWAGVMKFKNTRTREWNRRVWSSIRHFLVFYKPPVSNKNKFFEDYIEGEGKEKGFHKYQQSLHTFKYLVSKFSQVGDTVLDCFGGSGTTGIAAYEEGRKCILIEKEKKSVQVIKSRIAEHLSTKKDS